MLSATKDKSVSSSVINATHRFKTHNEGYISNESNDFHEGSSTNVIEANDYPIHMQIPISLQPGQRIRINLIKEKTGTSIEKTNIEPKISRIMELETKYSKLFNEHQKLLEKLQELDLSKEEETLDKEVIELNPVNSMHKTINAVSNIGISIFLTSGITFCLLAIFNIVIPRMDSLFGLFLSLMLSSLFSLDKLYRRNLNQ
jgi:hypothetical protein